MPLFGNHRSIADRSYQPVLICSLWMAANIMGFALISYLVKGYGTEISRPITVPYRVLCSVMAAWILLHALITRQWASVSKYIYVLAALFWSVYIYRILQDTALNPVMLGMPGNEYYAWVFGGCIPAFIAGLSVRDQSRYRWAPSLILLMGTLVCILGFSFNRSMFVEEVARRQGNEILDHINYGHSGAITFTMGLLGILDRLPRSVRTPKIVMLIPIALGLYTVLISVSRGALISLAVTSVLIIVSSKKLSITIRAVCVAATVILFLSDVLLVVEGMGVQVMNYYGSVEAFTTGASTEGRIEFMVAGFTQFLSSPILGDSLEVRGYFIYPHNVIVEALMATGLVGGLAYIGLIVSAMRNALRNIFYDQSFAYLGILFFHYITGAMFSGGLAGDVAVWMVLGICLVSNDVGRHKASPQIEKGVGRPEFSAHEIR